MRLIKFIGVESSLDSEPVVDRRRRRRRRSCSSGLIVDVASVNPVRVKKTRRFSRCGVRQLSLLTRRSVADCPLQFCSFCGGALLHSCSAQNHDYDNDRVRERESRQSSSPPSSHVTVTQLSRESESESGSASDPPSSPPFPMR